MMKTHTFVRHGVCAAAVMLLCASSSYAQAPARRPLTPVSLSGPRVGATFLSPGVAQKLKDSQIDTGWAFSQFGWQLEKRIKTGPSGLSAVNEWVFLAGGLEQGVVIPSVSWLVGLRTGSGVEFGLGPNVTPAGVALAMAGGVTVSRGALNVPFNVAVVPSRSGVRVSVLTGFNLRR
jgi:hypothetical protein